MLQCRSSREVGPESADIKIRNPSQSNTKVQLKIDRRVSTLKHAKPDGTFDMRTKIAAIAQMGTLATRGLRHKTISTRLMRPGKWLSRIRQAGWQRGRLAECVGRENGFSTTSSIFRKSYPMGFAA